MWKNLQSETRSGSVRRQGPLLWILLVLMDCPPGRNNSTPELRRPTVNKKDIPTDIKNAWGGLETFSTLKHPCILDNVGFYDEEAARRTV